MESMESSLDLDSGILRESLMQYRRPGLAFKRRNTKDLSMAMKPDLLRNQIIFLYMKVNAFTCFLGKYPTIEASGGETDNLPQ